MPSSKRRYGVAVIATIVTLMLRLALEGWVGGSSPYMFFIPAVMLSAWYGGFGPGLMTTLAGGIMAHFLMTEPERGGFGLLPADLPRMTIFLIGGFQISWLSGEMYAARRRAEADAAEARRAREELQWAHDNLERIVRERTAELHFQKTLLESQSQASVEGILAVGNGGRVIFANRRFGQMWGVDEAAVCGEPVEGVRHAVRRQLAAPQDPLPEVDDRGGAALPERDGAAPVELPTADGRAIERYAAPIVDPAGNRFGRVWFFRDTTERKRLEREILEIGERERRRIGQDLHDDLCQQLTGIACMGRVLERRLRASAGNGARAAAEEAGEIVQLVQQATERARDLAKGLRPIELHERGLAVALQELSANIKAMFGVKCTFNGNEGAAPAVGDDVAIQLYRIAQEAISNAIRHGRASEVWIDLVAAGGRVLMTIEDDGVGIPDPVPARGIGLHGMDYRARMIGGTLTVERGKPVGTVVTCSLPVEAAAKTDDVSTGMTTNQREAVAHGGNAS